MQSQPFDYPTANLSTTWVNSVSTIHSVDFSDGSKVRAIQLRGTLGPKYACGFYCNGNCESYIFAIFIVQSNSISQITSPAIGFAQVVWSVNRSKLVKINSTLQLTSGGDLVLRGADGTLAWSTNTTGKSVVGLSLTVEGNLVLFDSKNGIVWQSFNHPNDALVLGQKLSNPPQTYFSRSIGGLNASRDSNYVVYLKGSLSLSSNSSNNWQTLVSISRASSAQYMKLEFDGHLKVYEWQSGWNEVDDLLTGFNVEREFPGLPTAGATTPKPFFTGVILGFVIGLSILGIKLELRFLYSGRRERQVKMRRIFLDHVSGMPTRFSYDDLKAATENFTKKLGEGGFGSVFEGCLVNGKKITVKCLDGIGQVKKSFLVEVETIGSIHHANLVQLIGFCTEKSHRLLIYEFMTNGSLEKWIYHGKQELTIDWNCRRMIIQDIAKGLAYLHEECRQKILHLDNILLDEKYNAKLSDFGLALIGIRAKS
ncbi:hypothetical protein P3S67_016524 [Capsicum chacoense]